MIPLPVLYEECVYDWGKSDTHLVDIDEEGTCGLFRRHGAVFH